MKLVNSDMTLKQVSSKYLNEDLHLLQAYIYSCFFYIQNMWKYWQKIALSKGPLSLLYTHDTFSMSLAEIILEEMSVSLRIHGVHEKM